LGGLFSDESKGKEKRLGLLINFYLLPQAPATLANGVLGSQNCCNEVKRHIQHLKELVVTCVTCLVVVVVVVAF